MKKILIDGGDNNDGNTVRWRTGTGLFSEGALERPPSKGDL